MMTKSLRLYNPSSSSSLSYEIFILWSFLFFNFSFLSLAWS
jgi:hypothetical protein